MFPLRFLRPGFRKGLIDFPFQAEPQERAWRQLPGSNLVFRWVFAALVLLGVHSVPGWCPASAMAQSTSTATASDESRLLTRIRQLTLEGRRSGEGYFSASGKQLVFQSERDAANPFFQIFLLNLETGDTRRVSPGQGKTTCAWIHPNEHQVLFASTHADPASVEKQQAELKARTEGKERRYSWDYDPAYELYVQDLAGGPPKALTQAMGYDAEGSYSPEGDWIVFASNRRAYLDEANSGTPANLPANDTLHLAPLSPEERKRFELDPAFAIDLFLCDAQGGQLQRLTDAPGYDGGPFFSADGKRICWRRFSADGATAEIYSRPSPTSNRRGSQNGLAFQSQETRLTQLGAMSWAPYFHPSGEYLIFTTNVHGFDNFELYLVDASGSKEPVRVTNTAGFDGLPAFSPDGKQLCWTSNRGAGSQSQLYLAAWNHAAARELLQQARPVQRKDSAEGSTGSQATTPAAALPDATGTAPVQTLNQQWQQQLHSTAPEISIPDLIRHVDALCRPEMAGRMTGTPGEELATAYVASCFEFLGLEPAGVDGTYFQPFEFVSGATLGPDNQLLWGEFPYQVDQTWRPLAFSKLGEVPASPVVFAGYGIVTPAGAGSKEPPATLPANAEQKANSEVAGAPPVAATPPAARLTEYDSYVHLDVKDKWVLALRYLPEDITPEERQLLAPYSSLRFKSMVARERGARGLILVSGPRSGVKEQLVPLELDAAYSESSLPVISVTDELASMWITASTGKKLEALQSAFDQGAPQMGFELPGVFISAKIDIQQQKRTGRNVLGRLKAVPGIFEAPSGIAESPPGTVVVGAHVDHLGNGGSSNSLAKENERTQIHWGADDNASGVACMLELAQSLARQQALGELQFKHDFLFAAWSGEELGLLGSSHFVKQLPDPSAATMHDTSADPHALPADPHALTADPHAALEVPVDPHAAAQHPHAAPAEIVACLNLDMVGRLQDKLVLQGLGSSDYWKGAIERGNVPLGIPLTLQDDCYLPTDASSFYLARVPILSAFTGSHGEYHTPRDRPDLLNYQGMQEVGQLMLRISGSLANKGDRPAFQEQARRAEDRPRGKLRAYLGSIPDYAQADIKGVLLSGVTAGAPAAQAGVEAGDIIVELAGKKIENIYDYTFAIESLKIGQPAKIVVERKGARVELQVTPGSRE